jgi:hypothetical protein
MSAARHFTRKQMVEYLRDQGFPVTMHAMNKYCAPARNEGPQPVAYWGRLPLYEPESALKWAEARLRPVSLEAA